MVARNVEVLKGRPMTARTKEIIDKREKIIENRYEPPLRHCVPPLLKERQEGSHGGELSAEPTEGWCEIQRSE